MIRQILCLSVLTSLVLGAKNLEAGFKKPSVVVAVLVRNKAHTLPYFLTFLENLDYPKDRITLWIRSDNNIDNSIEILRAWLRDVESSYHRVDTYFDKKSSGLHDETSHSHWSPKRFLHVMNLREEALDFARKNWADYVMILDADVFFIEPSTLNSLMSHDLNVVGPLLKSDGLYSNFWAGMTPEYYYLRTESYLPILDRKMVGCFPVPMIHSAVLINLRTKASDFLTYQSKNVPDYNGPEDDIIAFAIMANKSDIPLHICNDKWYGFVMTPLENYESLELDKQQLTNIKLEMLNVLVDIPIAKGLQKFIQYPPKDTFGLSQVYMINLIRRPERRTRMLRVFDVLGVKAEIIDGVDGSNLNTKILDEIGVKIMPNYADPYHKRPMTMGEVGCFLSHYSIWRQVVENRFDKIMVLEDDVRFEPFFRQKVNAVLTELEDLNVKWDLVYLGRKRMDDSTEERLEGSRYLVTAGYSYWTVGYLLSARGAKKLIDANPLDNLVPVDEYLPILSGKHPRSDWNEFYRNRNLVTLSTAPLLLYPLHYTGEPGYISDTQDSKVITENDASEESEGRDEL